MGELALNRTTGGVPQHELDLCCSSQLLLPVLLAAACHDWDLALEVGQDVCFCGVQLLRKLNEGIFERASHLHQIRPLR